MASRKRGRESVGGEVLVNMRHKNEGKESIWAEKEVGSDQQKRGCVSEKQRLMEESGKQKAAGKLEEENFQ